MDKLEEINNVKKHLRRSTRKDMKRSGSGMRPELRAFIKK